MENSVINDHEALSSSSNTKTIHDDDDDDSPEESSWTFYMQDFEYGGSHNKNSSFSCGYETSNHTLVSDAASSAARNLAISSERSNINGNNLVSFKRRPRRAKAGGVRSVNDDLEDTASSPVNSPKISYMNQLTMKQDEPTNKNAVSDFNNQGPSDSSHNKTGLDILEGNTDHSELKKKGLCLAPVFMLEKYFG